MVSQSYNLMWISPTFADANAPFREPIPNKTVGNIVDIARRNPDVDVRLWVDSHRLTGQQRSWLEKMITDNLMKNLSVQDLRTIAVYNLTHLFNTPDPSPNWRFDKHSLIWRQVDAARILASLQGGYGQSFYSDADITSLTVNDRQIQLAISRHGVILSGGVSNGFAWYENGMFGFDRSRQNFFRQLYDRTIQKAISKQENGYGAYIDLINSELKDRYRIDTREIVFEAQYHGTVALCPSEQANSNTLGQESSQPTSSTLEPSVWDSFGTLPITERLGVPVETKSLEETSETDPQQLVESRPSRNDRGIEL